MTKEEKKEYMKEWRLQNKNKIKEYKEANKDKIKEKQKRADKKYYEKNIESIKEKKKEKYKYTRDKVIEKQTEYQKTENGKKNRIIHNWINKYKIKFADRNEAEFYYNSYINTHRCTWCDKMFKDSKDRCMDHCHTCGLPRAIICKSCNNKDLVPCVNCLL